MTPVAIIGSGPTGIYTLKGLLTSPTPLSITIFEDRGVSHQISIPRSDNES